MGLHMKEGDLSSRRWFVLKGEVDCDHEEMGYMASSEEGGRWLLTYNFQNDAELARKKYQEERSGLMVEEVQWENVQGFIDDFFLDGIQLNGMLVKAPRHRTIPGIQ